MMSPFKIFKVPADWKALDYPDREIGTAKITHHKYTKGKIYLMENVDGYELFQVTKSFPVTELRIHNKVCMIDDPMHFIGMQKLAECSEGKVLVGGLGLGIIVHHLVKNPRVTQIDVAEKNDDVIKLILPLLPKLPCLSVHLGDIFESKWVHGHYDTIVLDIWVKRGKQMEVAGVNDYNVGLTETFVRFQCNNPKSRIFVFGSRRPQMNPAVTEPREVYINLCREMRQDV